MAVSEQGSCRCRFPINGSISAIAATPLEGNRVLSSALRTACYRRKPVTSTIDVMRRY
jgi:hypothetical protein